jgi:hypothetical protein
VIALCVFLAAVVLLVVLGILLPVRVHVSLQGEGDPSGHWVLAGGSRCGPFSVTSAAAPKVDPFVQVHLWRWRLWRRTLEPRLEEPAEPEDEGEASTPLDRYRRLERWFDPPDLAEFLLGEHKRVRLDRMEVSRRAHGPALWLSVRARGHVAAAHRDSADAGVGVRGSRARRHQRPHHRLAGAARARRARVRAQEHPAA